MELFSFFDNNENFWDRSADTRITELNWLYFNETNSFRLEILYTCLSEMFGWPPL